MAKTDRQNERVFRPGAIISVEGERGSTLLRIDAGVVEESMGTQTLGRRSTGDIVPRLTRGRAEVTTRAITVVKASVVTDPGE